MVVRCCSISPSGCIMSALSDQSSAQLSVTGWGELDQPSSSSVCLNLQLGGSPGYERPPYDACMLPFLVCFLLFSFVLLAAVAD